MLSPSIYYHRPHHQFRTTVKVLHPFLLCGSVGDYLPIHPLLIIFFLLVPHRAAGVAEHTKLIHGVFPKTNPVEQPGHGVNQSLKSDQVRQCNQAVIRV